MSESQSTTIPEFSHVGDRFATWGLNTAYLTDERFVSAWRESLYPVAPLIANKTPEVLRIDWKAYVCCWAAQQALHSEGDFVECGVNYGILSRTVARYVDFARYPERTFWLYDTFCGIPPEQMSDTEARGLGAWHNKNNYICDVFPIARHRFSPFPNARLVQGKVPESLYQVAPDQVVWLHIDMNITFPEISAAEFFWPRIPQGGIIILDDYAYRGHEEQMQSFQKFAAERGQNILALPTGQGMIVKA